MEPTKPDQVKDFQGQISIFEKNVYDKIDPKDKGALQRVVVAGQKVMFSKETHQYMLEALDKEGQVADKLAIGIVQLMKMLFAQSKGTMPPQIIIPAASILLVKAAEFVDKTEGGMTIEVFGDALKLAVVGIREEFSKAGKQGQPSQSPEASQPAPQGLINQQGV